MIVLIVINARKYYQLIKTMRDVGLSFISPNKLPYKCRDDDIVLCDEPGCDYVKGKCNKYNVTDVQYSKIFEILPSFQGKKLYRELVVGIDIGKELAFVLLGDGQVLLKGKKTENEMIEALREFYNIPHEKYVVRIGKGDREKAWEIASMIVTSSIDVVVELVDEHRTTKAKWPDLNERDLDIKAAYIIASKRGSVKLIGHEKRSNTD